MKLRACDQDPATRAAAPPLERPPEHTNERRRSQEPRHARPLVQAQLSADDLCDLVCRRVDDVLIGRPLLLWRLIHESSVAGRSDGTQRIPEAVARTNANRSLIKRGRVARRDRSMDRARGA